MKKTITSEIVVGYSQCPSKAYLLLCTEKSGTQHEYMQILEKQRQNAQRNYIEDLRQRNAVVQPYSLLKKVSGVREWDNRRQRVGGSGQVQDTGR